MRTNLLTYLEHIVAQYPEKTAFVGDTDAVTFDTVYREGRAIGAYLCSNGLYKEPVAVFMEKQPAMVVSFMGVLYAGCFYVPLDSEMPAFRIRLILENVNPRMIICDEKSHAVLVAMGYAEGSHLYEAISKTPVNEAALCAVREKAIDVDPVYVVFTSGSTGIPKGVIASHRSVIDYVENLSDIMGFNKDTVFGNQTPLYVDACLKEIYPTLKYGATTFLIPKSLFMFPIKLVEYLNTHNINTICWVVSDLTLVSAFGTLDKTTPETLHTIAFGSEVFPVKQFNRWRKAVPQGRFIHLYGPTEATGMSMYYEVDRDFAPDEVIPLGKPFKNTEVLLLTDEGCVPKPGEPGEICIRGAGLSLGYWGDPDKTRNAFVQNPLSVFPDIIYKTGDLGRYNERGELVFLSRRDHQIKHMGHRIELAEIEWAVAQLKDVHMACVVFDNTSSRIVLYYVAEDVTPAAMAAYCRGVLPRYMVPYAYIPVEKLPLTANGKIDRADLSEQYKSSCSHPARRI